MAANLDPLTTETSKQTRIDSWKGIAAFFGRDERTVKRWEKERGLPVHRVPGSSRGTVFAYPPELTLWLRQGSVQNSAADASAPLKGESETNLAGEARTPERERISLSKISVSNEADVNFRSNRMREALSGEAFVQNRPAAATTVSTLLWILPVLAVLAVSAYVWNRGIWPAKALLVAHQPNPETQDLYLKGRYYFEKRTPGDLNKAVDLFTQAIVHDPAYAQAYVGLADSYHLLREYSAMPTREAEERAFAAAKKATELDPNSAAAHTSLAFASFWGYMDVAGADREFRRAIELDPNFTRAHHWYATFLIEIGRAKEALAEIERARQLDPSSKAILADKGFILAGAGRTEEARALLLQMESSDPDFLSAHGYLVMIDEMEGNFAAFLKEQRVAAGLKHDPAAEREAIAAEAAYKAGGARGLHEYQLRYAQRNFEQGGSAYAVARSYAILEKPDFAMQYLKLADRQHDTSLATLAFDPFFRPMHSDPAFQALLTHQGLPLVN